MTLPPPFPAHLHVRQALLQAHALPAPRCGRLHGANGLPGAALLPLLRRHVLLVLEWVLRDAEAGYQAAVVAVGSGGRAERHGRALKGPREGRVRCVIAYATRDLVSKKVPVIASQYAAGLGQSCRFSVDLYRGNIAPAVPVNEFKAPHHLTSAMAPLNHLANTLPSRRCSGTGLPSIGLASAGKPPIQ